MQKRANRASLLNDVTRTGGAAIGCADTPRGPAAIACGDTRPVFLGVVRAICDTRGQGVTQGNYLQAELSALQVEEHSW